MRNRWIPQLEREFDRCIMDVLQATAIKQGKRINRCRVYLQATTIADIATTEGNMITEFAWGLDKNPANNQRISKHEWPRQPRPGPKAWAAWRAALQRYLSKDGKSRYLRQPLGQWTVTPQQSRQQWKHYYDHTTGRKYQINEGTWTSYLTKGGQEEPDTRQQTTELPSTARPSHQGPERNNRRRQSSRSRHSEAIQEPPETMQEYIETLDPWEAKLLQTVQNLNNQTKVAAKILTKEQIDIVSDGGMTQGY
jgi:hypothetical protein